MKNLEEANHYDLLELTYNASFFEIRQAYKDALSVYDEDSLITYSLFSEDERRNILKEIEDAFLTLVDQKRRAKYDKMLVENGKVDVTLIADNERKKPIPLFQNNRIKNKDFFSKKIKKKIEEKDHTKISEEIFSGDLISGIDLRAFRKSIGVSLEDIFEVTRINLPVLRAIEENQFEMLPPAIYLKNFLRTYAEILRLDPETIVDGYIENMNQNVDLA